MRVPIDVFTYFIYQVLTVNTRYDVEVSLSEYTTAAAVPCFWLFTGTALAATSTVPLRPSAYMTPYRDCPMHVPVYDHIQIIQIVSFVAIA